MWGVLWQMGLCGYTYVSIFRMHVCDLYVVGVYCYVFVYLCYIYCCLYVAYVSMYAMWYILPCVSVWYVWLSICAWCPNPGSWHINSRTYVSIFHISFSLKSFSGSMLEKLISELCLLLGSSSPTMLLYLSSTFKCTFMPTSIYAHGPLIFLSHPLIMFFRARSRSDFLLQLSWCFLFILERCLNKGLDALLLIPRCLSWQRSSAEGTELRG